MLIRLIILGAAAALLAAFLGKTRLAAGLLIALVIIGGSLWTYEQFNTQSESELFAPGEVTVTDLQLKPSGYRPNLFELRGEATNRSENVELEGLTLGLIILQCSTPQNECSEYAHRDANVELKLQPGETGELFGKIYLTDPLPKDEIQLEYKIKRSRGHVPVWE